MLSSAELGFYYHNGRSFFEKTSLVNYITENNTHDLTIDYYFNDHVFKKIDTTLEPEIDIESLYIQRAKNLREQYRYLILAFSGGSDSNEILHTFVMNNIFLDEIVIVHYNTLLKNIKEFDNKLNKFLEYDNQAKKILELVKKNSPKTKITTIDYTDKLLNLTKNTDSLYTIDRHVHITNTLNPNISEIRYYASSVAEKENNVGVIYGFDKPILKLENNILYFHFNDVSVACATPSRIGLLSDKYDSIAFFWTGNVPLITIKQAHLMKKLLENNNDLYKQFVYATIETKNYNYAANFYRKFNSIIYKYWNDSYFAASKNLNDSEENYLLNNFIEEKDLLKKEIEKIKY